MTEFHPGTYIIVPKDVDAKEKGLGLGQIPSEWPPKDRAVTIVERKLIDKWIIRKAENNTFTVYAGRGQPNDYKWTTQYNVLTATAEGPPTSFRFESAGDGLWVIGIFGQDLLLTADLVGFPPLAFKPADGSNAQRFQAIHIH